MNLTTPSIISHILWGGIFVAMPTAMPELPLIRRFGSLDGKTVGSNELLSKFGTNFTVSLSISKSISSAILLNLASVYLIAAAESPSTLPKFPCPEIRGYLKEKS